MITTLHSANLFFETMKPWELKKSDARQNDLEAVLHLTMETLRICGIILQPIIPHLSNGLLNKLNVSTTERKWTNLKQFSWENVTGLKSRNISGETEPLFRRIILDKEKKRKKT